MKQSMSILGALLAITLSVPAQAQFAKPEDAIKYRKASLNRSEERRVGKD